MFIGVLVVMVRVDYLEVMLRFEVMMFVVVFFEMRRLFEVV